MVDCDQKKVNMEEPSNGEGGSGLNSGGSSNLTDNLTAQVLLKKGKRYAAKFIRDECLRNMSPEDTQAPRTQVSMLCTVD